jgi:integrase
MYLIKTRSGIYYIKMNSTQTKSGFKSISTKTRSKKDALIFLNNYKWETEKTTLPANINLGCFHKKIIQYLTSSDNHSKLYCKHVNYMFLEMIKQFGADKQIRMLTTREIDMWISGMGSIYGSSQYYRMLNSMLNRAVIWDYLDVNPMNKLRPPRLPKNHPVFINEIELMKIVDNEPSSHFKNIYKTAFYTGMRRSELLNLVWQDVDLDNRIILVRNSNRHMTKSRKQRNVPMAKKMYLVIHQVYENTKVTHREPTHLVFGKHYQNKWYPSTISHRFKSAVRLAGLSDDIKFHSLRHSFGSMLAQAGVSLQVIKELMGHADYSTTLRYAHLQMDNLTRAVAELDKL